jgi:dihydrofolate reductase
MTGRLIYLFNVSLDGFTAAADGSLNFSAVDDELHTFFNDELRSVEASLYGRRLYETMAAHWPTGESDPEATEPMREFARIWNPHPKIVFSHSLDRVEHNSRLMRGDVAAALDELRSEFSGDLAVGGPNLAGQFVRRGLIDEYRMVVHPVVLGTGTPYWPQLEAPLSLRLKERRPFPSGAELRTYVPG